MSFERNIAQILFEIQRKNLVALHQQIDAFIFLLDNALANANISFQDEKRAIDIILKKEDDPENRYLADLQTIIASATRPENFHALNQLMTSLLLSEYRRAQLGDRDTKSVQRFILYNDARNKLSRMLYLKDIELYDLSFISTTPMQSMLGKAKNNYKIYPRYPSGLLNKMHPNYWLVDPKSNVPYLSCDDKKHIKVRIRHGQIYRDLDGHHQIKDDQYVYVLSPKGRLYILNRSDQEKEQFKEKDLLFYHHSTPRAGNPVLCAGNIKTEDGVITEIDNSSGHYSPSTESLIFSICWLFELGILNEQCYVKIHNEPLLHGGGRFEILKLIQDERIQHLVDVYKEGNPCERIEDACVGGAEAAEFKT